MFKRFCLFIMLLIGFVLPVVAQNDVTVPDVIGLTVPEATAILNTAGLNLGAATTADPAAGQTPNTIVAQAIDAGAVVPFGTALDFSILRAANVRLIYDDNDLTFINLTPDNMNTNGIVFNAVDGTPATYSANQISGGLGGAQCLQLWSVNRGNAKDVAGCDSTLWRTTNNTAFHFWTQSNGVNSFNIVEDGIERAVCPAASTASQDSPLTCEFYIAGGSSGGNDATPYIYLAYTQSAIAFINNSDTQWMLTNQTTILNNNPALDVSSAPLIFGDTNLLREEFRANLGDVTRLAPGQCIMFTLEGADVIAPPEDCHVITQRALSPDIAFWVASFGVRSSTDGRDRTCPAALVTRLTLCILPR